MSMKGGFQRQRTRRGIEMNKKRLLKLADLLEADAKNEKGIKFDLSTWGRADEGVPTISCGTTACAIGLAVVSGAFKRAGLSNMYEDGSDRICPQFEGTWGFEAAGKLFGIPTRHAEFLFSEDYYPRSRPATGAAGERLVANRIRDFVAGKVSP